MKKQIKSKERVKNFAEVFTAEREVKAMCDLVDDCCQDINATFLEPSCGNGNFLVEIISRKLNNCKTDDDILVAYRSIYGIELLEDNALECRERLQKIASVHTQNKQTLLQVIDILENNIICGNALEIMKCMEEQFNES